MYGLITVSALPHIFLYISKSLVYQDGNIFSDSRKIIGSVYVFVQMAHVSTMRKTKGPARACLGLEGLEGLDGRQAYRY